MDTEYLFMLPINWLNHHVAPDVNVEIVKNLYNAYCTPKSFFVEKDFDSWYPKTHCPCNYIQSFYMESIIYKCGTTNHYQLKMFQNGISKHTRSSITGNIDYGIPSSSFDSAITPKKKKNRHAMFKI